MGLFSRIVKNIGRIAEDVAPVVVPLVAGAIGGVAGVALAGALFPPPSAGGSAAVVQANLGRPGCPSAGIVGSNAPFANPITRAAISPGFDVNRLPARPVFGAIQQLIAQQPQFLFPQTTSFRQQGFGQAVSPSFRPFTPSFRTGQPGVQGQFVPGVSQGFAPQFPQQFPRAPIQRFAGRFGGFGGFGFGGF